MVRSKGEILVPRYNKSAFNGQGDRADISKFRRQNGPLDLVIVEGWMLGFSSLPAKSPVLSKYPGMDRVNDYMKEYSRWEDQFDSAILVGVKNIDMVYQWREQAEEIRRATG